MNLLWAVPVVCAAVAVTLVLARARALEDVSHDLVVAVRRTSEMRRPLAGLQRELRRSGPLADRVWSHWDDGSGGDDAPSGRENAGEARH